MKIARIAIKNFLGLDHLDIAIERPVLLVAGPNASGKTSIAHALRFVLDDQLCRVEHKKDIKDLIREGAKIGSVSVSLMNSGSDTGTVFEYTRSAATGHFTTPHPPPEPHPALRFVLDPGAFTELSAQERRGFLYKLMGVEISAANIIATLKARKHRRVLLDLIATQLRAGFPSAYTEMMGIAREAKGRWRGVTSETYGDVKATTWSCEAPEADISQLETLTQDIGALDAEIAQLQARQGALTERAATRKRLKDRVENAQRIAGEYVSRQNAANELRTQIDTLTAEQRDLREQLGRAKCGLTVEAHASSQGEFFRCPACSTGIIRSMGVYKVGEPAAVDVAAEISAVEAQVKELQIAVSNVDNRKRIADRLMVDATNAVGESRAAVESLRDFKEDGDVREDDADIADRIAVKVAARFAAQVALNNLEAANRAREEATDKTARAKAIHEEIQAATALAADLAPDGLPAELLAQAMRPINERLRDSSVMAGWSSVSITTDKILIHGRDWDLASESEKWRARAMIAEAIAHLSEIKCFLLDSLDILEPALRAQALAWLLAVAPEHETIIVLATLKQPPTNLPGEIQSVWLGT